MATLASGLLRLITVAFLMASLQQTRLQIILSQILGNRAITMNLFDMVGSPTSEDPRAGRAVN